MNKNINRFFQRKFAAILIFAVSAIVFLPEALYAKGAVIGYATGNAYTTFPINFQLFRFTHMMASDLYPDAN
jgi:hypothetical protein